MLKPDIFKKDPRKMLGALGEKLAEKFLAGQGYRTVMKNYLIYGGQIDLIMTSPQGNLVFVEVKTRLQDSFETSEIILSQKQLQTIKKTAFQFLQTMAFPFVTWQLDLLCIHLDGNAYPVPQAKIKHYQNILEI